MLNQEQIDEVCCEVASRKNVTGILLCGSYIYGQPTNASDLDIRAITNDGSNSDERETLRFGTRIELFTNSPERMRRYFEECLVTGISHAVHFWANGQIISDMNGILAKLQSEARELYKRGPNIGVWKHKEKWIGREVLKIT